MQFVTALFLTVITTITLLLAIPPAIKKKSWFYFLFSIVITNIGIIFPFMIFLISSESAPEWKGGCRFGWLDCFETGKIALIPILLWAYTSFYEMQLMKPDNKSFTWVVFSGIFSGVIITSVWLTFWFMIYIDHPDKFLIMFPLYSFIWFLILFIKLIKKKQVNTITYIKTFLVNFAFIIVGFFWSIKIYFELPDTEPPPPCFVVTAALRGHKSIVGPFVEIERHGCSRIVNSQLITFWRFEKIWAFYSPCTHKLFRIVYNRIGPVFAAQISSKLLADFVFFLLKPFEILAVFIIYLSKKKKS